MQVEIVEFETTRIAVLEHRRPVEQINDTAGKFIVWRKESGLSPVETSWTFGTAYETRTPPSRRNSASTSAAKWRPMSRPIRGAS
jgi:DNA gyrase inhibitor GyrI